MIHSIHLLTRNRVALPADVPPVGPHRDPIIWVCRVASPSDNFDSVTATSDECMHQALEFLRTAKRLEESGYPSSIIEAMHMNATLCIRWSQLKDFASRDARKDA